MSKIAIIGPAYPYRGGQALVEAHLYHTLSQAGFDCHTITFTLLYPSLFFPGKTQYDTSSIIPYPHKERITRLINSISPLSWFKTIHFIEKLQPDGVIFIWWMPFFGPAYNTIAKGIRKRTRAKIIFLVENFISHEKRWFDPFFTKITLRKADAFICQSNYIQNQLTKVFPTIPVYKTTLSIYDCYNLNRYTKDEARAKLGVQKEKVILSFGLIRPYKGIKKLIEAFQIVGKYYPNCELWIVGECYEDVSHYEQLIKKHPYVERIHFRNQYVPNEELELYFKAADLICLPYESGTQSGILMIAYAFEVPVVVTKVGGLPELVKEGKTGHIVPNNAPETLAEGLLYMLQQDLVQYKPHIRDLAATLGYQNIPEIITQILNSAHESA